jgi:hypothetical protein
MASGLGTELTPSIMLHDRDYFMDRVGELIALHKERGWTLKEGMCLCMGALVEMLLLDLTTGLELDKRLAKMDEMRPKLIMRVITAFLECRKEVTNE